MKTKWIRAGGLLIAAGGLILASGCAIEPNGRVVFAPPVIVAPAPVVVAPAPPPPAPEPVYVPDSYVWDGYEYVGIVGDQYFYLGPGNVWLVCEPFRLERFHGWEGGHRDWREHAIRNDRFRTDRYGHVQPRRGPERRPDDRH
jgi:hypothetical protein